MSHSQVTVTRISTAAEPVPSLREICQQDRNLVDRCLSGTPGAWDELYHKYHALLMTVANRFMGASSYDDNLAEEMATRVWYQLVSSKGQLLGRYDPNRGFRLSQYLAAFTRNQVMRHARSERRRRVREKIASKSDSQPQSIDPDQLEIDEFLATLTQREREFLNWCVATANEGEDDETAGFSKANEYQLRHRVQRKLRKYFDRL